MSFTDLGCEREPVFLFHVEVNQRHVHRFPPDDLERLRRACRFDPPPLRLELVERLSGIDTGQLAVIDHEYGNGHQNPQWYWRVHGWMVRKRWMLKSEPT